MGNCISRKKVWSNNQCPLDFIASKALVTWGSIYSIESVGGWGGLDCSVMMSGGCGNVDVRGYVDFLRG